VIAVPVPRRVLLVGGGGREHALAWLLAGEAGVEDVVVVPGSAGIATVGGVRVVAGVAPTDPDAVVAAARAARSELVVVGPEAPLAAGVADALAATGLPVFGPSAAAARIESSKAFCHDVAEAAGIPMARAAAFAGAEPARAFAAELAAAGDGVVVKADGLAAGKGVVVATTLDEAERAVEAMFAGLFGQSGAEVVIEDCLEGEEASFFAICDGARAVPFATAQDHKRVGDGDTGPNTGGMGAYSPASVVTPEIEARVMAEIVEPTMRAMREKGAPFKGVLYAGLMLTKDGPRLIEYNTRFGDPEAQVILPRLEDDLLAIMLAAASGALAAARPNFSNAVALTVVLAAKGYPGTPLTGSEIRGVADAAAMADVIVTHAGTRAEGPRLLAAGGRVLNVTALASSVADAQAKAYRAVDAIDWPGGFCRRDIGWREIERERG
jgi:phosphoribosylamine--glycine ligase